MLSHQSIYAVNPDPAKSSKANLIIQQALQKMHEESDVRIGQLAQQLGISERYLEKRFQTATGVSPKKYMQRLRFNRTVTMLKNNCDMMDIVVELGYHDQAHLINDFKKFAGCAPSRYNTSPGLESLGLRTPVAA
ncbi:MAG: AraC family transcriptional regulator [Cyclobacteriaceae bacterium]|nr:AraC family transcriptional regulator [Cyclobacteriaceae bacterium]